MEIKLDFTLDDIRQVVADEVSKIMARESGAGDKLLTRDDVCRICHISKPTFHAWVNKGAVEVQKVGRRVFVRADDLDNALKTKQIYKFKHQD